MRYYTLENTDAQHTHTYTICTSRHFSLLFAKTFRHLNLHWLLRCGLLWGKMLSVWYSLRIHIHFIDMRASALSSVFKCTLFFGFVFHSFFIICTRIKRLSNILLAMLFYQNQMKTTRTRSQRQQQKINNYTHRKWGTKWVCKWLDKQPSIRLTDQRQTKPKKPNEYILSLRFMRVCVCVLWNYFRFSIHKCLIFSQLIRFPFWNERWTNGW